jgi:hypothetical protein
MLSDTESQLVRIEESKKRKNLNQGQIMMRILVCLCRFGCEGANSYAIQHHSNVKTQDSNRFKKYLHKLCDLNLIQSHDEQTSGKSMRTRYKILKNGRMTVSMYKSSVFKEIFGPIDDV